MNIKKACKLLKVSRSGYYKYLERKPSARDIENSVLSTEIKKIFDDFDKAWDYGWETTKGCKKGVFAVKAIN